MDFFLCNKKSVQMVNEMFHNDFFSKNMLYLQGGKFTETLT